MSDNCMEAMNPLQDSEIQSQELVVTPEETTLETPESRAADAEALMDLIQQLINNQTTKPDFKTKLKSRKFWLAAAGCITGILGMLNSNGNQVASVIFAIFGIISVVIYCLSEGKIDEKRSSQLTEATVKLLDVFETIK